MTRAAGGLLRVVPGSRTAAADGADERLPPVDEAGRAPAAEPGHPAGFAEEESVAAGRRSLSIEETFPLSRSTIWRANCSRPCRRRMRTAPGTGPYWRRSTPTPLPRTRPAYFLAEKTKFATASPAVDRKPFPGPVDGKYEGGRELSRARRGHVQRDQKPVPHDLPDRLGGCTASPVIRSMAQRTPPRPGRTSACGRRRIAGASGRARPPPSGRSPRCYPADARVLGRDRILAP